MQAQSSEPVPPPDAAAEQAPLPGTEGTTITLEPGAVAEVARSRRISVAEATRRLEAEQRLTERVRDVERSLGGRTGGSYFDDSGALVLTTLDAAGDRAAAGIGARAQRVDDSAARLDDIIRQLDRLATQRGGGGVRSWSVDVPGNTVVVTVTAGASDVATRRMLDKAATFGAGASIEHLPADVMPQEAEWSVGGYQYDRNGQAWCSIGFNTVDSAGRNVILTAGHCLNQGGTMSRNGLLIGAIRSYAYPAGGNDYGTIWNSYPGYWQPSASVYLYNGTYLPVAASSTTRCGGPRCARAAARPATRVASSPTRTRPRTMAKVCSPGS